MTEVVQTDIRGTVRSVRSLAELDAIFERIRKTDPERYERLVAQNEYETQLKVLGLVGKAEKKEEAVSEEPKKAKQK